MKAVVYRGVGEVALESVPDPKIQQATDAIVRITSSVMTLGTYSRKAV